MMFATGMPKEPPMGFQPKPSLVFYSHFTSVFLIRSYGAPNGTGRCSVAECYDNTWAMLVQCKIKLGQYCQLVVALSDVGN